MFCCILLAESDSGVSVEKKTSYVGVYIQTIRAFPNNIRFKKLVDFCCIWHSVIIFLIKKTYIKR